ncbi:DUF421 domain-containing protein [Syntrophomonas palmitatica]|uniref:DUF421 domain-containing protein n=1 Tax=Syntrophomonas palmitatica TaxID=402877 RepID=UPI0006D0158A|nr:DUF421 domain-containing protein [Syntrophomonas palmitatica]
MLIIILRTFILFAFTVLFLRIMGKRQIGQLQPYELVVIIMISELAVIPMEDTRIPLINGIIPIFILFALEVALSFISLKSEKARGVICGKPSILIENSQIKEQELKRLRFNINDLLEELRLKDVSNISDVDYAILETNGQLSVILKSDKRPVKPKDLNIAPPYEGLPITLVIDGQVIHENLKILNYNSEWLKHELGKLGVEEINDVLLATVDALGNMYYQLKSATH